MVGAGLVFDADDRRKLLDEEYEHYRSLSELAHLAADSPFVGGEGSLDAPVMFVGEAPGAREAEQVRPFVGPAGQLLREEIDRAGLRAEECFLTNTVKYRPPRNRTPLHWEILASHPTLRRELDIVDPPLVVLLGGVALELVEPGAKISRLRGKPVFADGRIYLPTFHPSAALRYQEYHDAFMADFDTIAAVVKG